MNELKIGFLRWIYRIELLASHSEENNIRAYSNVIYKSILKRIHFSSSRTKGLHEHLVEFSPERPSGRSNDALESQVADQTSAQALRKLFGYVQKQRDDFKQVDTVTW